MIFWIRHLYPKPTESHPRMRPPLLGKVGNILSRDWNSPGKPSWSLRSTANFRWPSSAASKHKVLWKTTSCASCRQSSRKLNFDKYPHLAHKTLGFSDQIRRRFNSLSLKNLSLIDRKTAKLPVRESITATPVIRTNCCIEFRNLTDSAIGIHKYLVLGYLKFCREKQYL